jgi:putative restriction endonuclease
LINYWTRNELILAFNLYCILPFGRLHRLNPEIIDLSNLIGRTPSAVALKLVNFASLDPELKKRGIKGMSSHSKLDKQIFAEFSKDWTSLLIESELLFENYNKKISLKDNNLTIDKTTKGIDKIVKIKQRVNQNLFRKMVLSNYNETCAICNLNNSRLLVASHIVPWSKNEKERLNPHNGLCLCSIHDKSFDVGLITVNENLKLLISDELKQASNDTINNYFSIYEDKELNIPKKFYPSIKFLEYHNEYIFLGA